MTKEIDKSNLKQIILNFPQQFLEGVKVAKNIKIKGDFNKVIVCGMGGSALGGDILATYLEKELPVWVIRNYELPPKTDKKSLIFISSYSGNTEEPLSVYQEARKRKLVIVGFCSGGRLEKLCLKNKIPLVKYRKEVPPRYGLGFSFSSMVAILINIGLIKDKSKEILDSAEYLKKINLDQELKGKGLAKELINKIPLIYASERYKALAYNWKTKFNENSKITAFYNIFPELDHNELAVYTTQDQSQKLFKWKELFSILILKSSDDHSRILKKINLTTEIIREKGGKIIILSLQGRNFLEKTFSNILLSDWTSYCLALAYGIDPTPVRIIEELKEKLKT